MNDNFALFNEPRRPWLDPELVQARFLALSPEVHPDRVHNAPAEVRAEAHQRFARLNSACQCLRDPKERLRHLIELERGAKPAQLERLSFAATDFYFRLGQLCRAVDQYLAGRNKAGSPLLSVRSFEEGMHWKEELEVQQALLNARRAELETETRTLNAAWETAPDVGSQERLAHLPLDRIEEIYRELSYVLRWSDQIGQRFIRLATA